MINKDKAFFRKKPDRQTIKRISRQARFFLSGRKYPRV